MITAPKLLLKPIGSLITLALLFGCAPHKGSEQTNALGQIATTTPEPNKTPFLIIAHRGASGYRPEHTLASYQLAIDQGADFIEPDLVPTRDGHLIARHENALAVVELTPSGKLSADGDFVVLSATTDVAERAEFAHLLTVREIDGRAVGGWFSEDFTLAQIKTLWARERIPKLRTSNTAYTKERIPSLQEVLALTQQPGNIHIGLYPELKHPTHFRFGRRTAETTEINIDTAQLLVDALRKAQFRSTPANPADSDATPRLFIQCFEVETLRRLRHQLLPAAQIKAPLVQLFGPMQREPADIGYYRRLTQTSKSNAASNVHKREFARVYGPLADMLWRQPSYSGLADALPLIANDYASGIGPRKGDVAKLAKTSRSLGLELHPYTVRAEAFFLSPLRGALADSVAGELAALQQLGATGVFIDQPDLAVRWRAASSRHAGQHTEPTP